jgi:hypothetical protein
MASFLEDLAFGLMRGLSIYFFQRNYSAAETLGIGLGAKRKR